MTNILQSLKGILVSIRFYTLNALLFLGSAVFAVLITPLLLWSIVVVTFSVTVPWVEVAIIDAVCDEAEKIYKQFNNNEEYED